MNKFFPAMAIILMAWACQSGQSGDTVEEKEDTAPAAALEISYAIFCKDITQPGDPTPHHEVYAVAGRDTVIVGDLQACAVIAPEDYGKYKIPENAYQAVGGPLTDKVVYAAYIAQSPEGKIAAHIGPDFNYRAMVVFHEEDMANPSEVRPGAFVGSYVHSSADAAHVLYLGYSNRTLVGQVFALEGPLPDQEDSLMLAIARTASQVIPGIDVDYKDLSFTSSKGKGKFTHKEGRIESMIFTNWEGGRASLTFEKKDIGRSEATQ
jgi:hypothetical protein